MKIKYADPSNANPTKISIKGSTPGIREKALAAAAATVAGQAPQAAQIQQHPVGNANAVSLTELSAVNSMPSTESVAPIVSNEATAPSTQPSEAPRVEKTEDTQLSSEYAILARKEKALRMRDQQFRAREEELRRREESLKSQSSTSSVDMSKYVSIEDLRKNPSLVFDLGLNYDTLTNAALNAPKPEDVARNRELQELREEIKALKSASEQSKKLFEDQQLTAREQAVKQITRDAEILIKNDPAYETVRETGNIKSVVKLIEQTFDEEGILLSIEEAAQQVEDALVDRYLKAAQLKKIQSRLSASQSKASAPVAQSTSTSPNLSAKTLTNAASSSRPLSVRERAILAAKGELKG